MRHNALLPVTGLLAAAAGLAAGPACVAAESEFQPVTLPTGDGVELAGWYAPGRLGRKSPAVIVLDDVRGAARPKSCAAVASRLASAGCAVLRFDFRGHGGSTAVTPEFWADPTNRRLVRGYSRNRPTDRITSADFRPGYLPALLNDISAARAFLERRNDAGECNVGQLYLVGFGQGATLGTLWLGAEWQRFRSLSEFPARLAPSPEGRAVAGCVWVDLSPTLDRQPAPLATAVRRAEQRRGVLFGLVHAADDAGAVKVAADLARWAGGASGKAKLVATRSVADAGGTGPLAARPETVAAVVALFEDIRKTQAVPLWDERDFVESRYYWTYPGSLPALAKGEGEEAFRAVPPGLALVGR